MDTPYDFYQPFQGVKVAGCVAKAQLQAEKARRLGKKRGRSKSLFSLLNPLVREDARGSLSKMVAGCTVSRPSSFTFPFLSTALACLACVGERETGERGKDACNKEPLLFISPDAGGRKF